MGGGRRGAPGGGRGAGWGRPAAVRSGGLTGVRLYGRGRCGGRRCGGAGGAAGAHHAAGLAGRAWLLLLRGLLGLLLLVVCVWLMCVGLGLVLQRLWVVWVVLLVLLWLVVGRLSLVLLLGLGLVLVLVVGLVVLVVRWLWVVGLLLGMLLLLGVGIVRLLLLLLLRGPRVRVWGLPARGDRVLGRRAAGRGPLIVVLLLLPRRRVRRCVPV